MVKYKSFFVFTGINFSETTGGCGGSSARIKSVGVATSMPISIMEQF